MENISILYYSYFFAPFHIPMNISKLRKEGEPFDKSLQKMCVRKKDYNISHPLQPIFEMS